MEINNKCSNARKTYKKINQISTEICVIILVCLTFLWPTDRGGLLVNILLNLKTKIILTKYLIWFEKRKKNVCKKKIVLMQCGMIWHDI